MLYVEYIYILVYISQNHPNKQVTNGTAMAMYYMAEDGGKQAGKWDCGGLTSSGFHHWIEHV